MIKKYKLEDFYIELVKEKYKTLTTTGKWMEAVQMMLDMEQGSDPLSTAKHTQHSAK